MFLKKRENLSCYVSFSDNEKLHLIGVNKNRVSFEIVGNSSFKGYVDIVSSKGDSITTVKPTGSIVDVEKDLLPKGFFCAYFYSEDNSLQSTRYFTVEESKQGNVRISMSKKIYAEREKVSAKLSGLDSLSRMKVSVVHPDLLRENKSIYNIYGLNDVGLKTLANWTDSNISINDILQCFSVVENVFDKNIASYSLPEFEGKYISGTLKDKGINKVLTNVPLVLNYVGNIAQMDISKTDSLGRFRFCTNQYGEKEIAIQPLNMVSLNYNIELDDFYSDTYGEIMVPKFALTKAKADAINEAFVNMQVNSVYNINSAIPVKKDNGAVAFYGKTEMDIPISKYIELASVEEMLKEIVPMVFLQKRKGEYSIYIE